MPAVKNSNPIPYIAFLRGINVGGHKLISKDKLIKAFQDAGFDDVRTYIQSGNVLFASTEKDIKKLTAKSEKTLKEITGHEVPVIIRSIADIKKLIKSDPFGKNKDNARANVYVVFLADKPSAEGKKKLLARESDEDTVEVHDGHTLHLVMKDKGVPMPSNYAMNFVEKDLGVKGTSRNWNTVNKIAAL